MNVEELPAIVSNPVAICAVHLYFYSCIFTKASCGHIYRHSSIMLFRKDADQSFANPLSCSGTRGPSAKDSRSSAGRRPALSGSSDYELLSIWARSSATEPNLIVPCESLASIEPSV